MTVSLIRCETYDLQLVKQAILQALSPLGGMEAFVNPGEKVLLKANLLMKKNPEEATTTHPIFVQAVAEILMDMGAIVMIGDSPGGPFTESFLRGIYRSTGMEQVRQITGCSLNKNTNSFTVEGKKSKLLNKIVLTDMLNDVDKVINLPKMKTHAFATYTGAVKNLFGLVPGTIKAEYHVRMPDMNDFAEALIDICEEVKPCLHIMDGIVAMEGPGPSSGEPKEMHLIMVSSDPYEMDAVACAVMNLDIQQVPTLRKAAERGLGPESLDQLMIVGEPYTAFKKENYHHAPSTSGRFRKIPKPLLKLLVNTLKSRPIIHDDKCIQCGDCARSCPPKVIDMIEKKPVINYKKCISCFCCQELCPVKAITIKKSWLAKLIFR